MAGVGRREHADRDALLCVHLWTADGAHSCDLSVSRGGDRANRLRATVTDNALWRSSSARRTPYA